MLVLVKAMLHVAGSRMWHVRDISSDGGGCGLGTVTASVGSLGGRASLGGVVRAGLQQGRGGWQKHMGPLSKTEGGRHTLCTCKPMTYTTRRTQADDLQ